MKLLRLKCDGFGTLRGEIHFAPDRLSLLADDNERGKSTLLNALTAALYGLEGDRRSHRVITPLERWRPWGGGGYRIELEIETGGERLTVIRDFQRDTVEIWDDRGRERTDEFREGKDSFPVGKKLLGIDEDEFVRCAFLRQGELDQVVPDDERSRRDSTLHARLESAADTRGGDTNATEALAMLAGAAAEYTCPELLTTIKVETAIQRLEAKREMLGLEIAGLEHDLEGTSGPLEELTRLSEEETQTRAEVARWERERRAARATEIKARLDLDRERRAELEVLQTEAEALTALPQVTPRAESALRAAVGRFLEADRNLESLARRQRERDEERARLEAEAVGFQLYGAYSQEDADRLVMRAEELRRLERDHAKLLADFNTSRAALAARGYEVDRVELLTTRFGALTEDEQELLRTQPQRALSFQKLIANEERIYQQFAEAIRSIEMQKRSRRTPARVVLVAGVAGALAAAIAGAINPALPWILMVAGAGVVAVTGLALLLVGARARREERVESQKRVAEAEARLERLREQQAEGDRRLETLAARLNYGSPDGLLKEWSDYVRLIEARGPSQQIQQQLAQLERRREELLADTRALLEAAGGGPVEPAYLDITAAGIRQLHAAQHRLAEFDRGLVWVQDERATADVQVREIREEAVRILESSGLHYNADRPLEDHLDDLALMAQSATRFALVIDVLIPNAANGVLDDTVRADLESQLGAITAEPASAGVAAGANGAADTGAPDDARPVDFESKIHRLRLQHEQVTATRNELRLQFEHRWRRSHDSLVAKRAELEAVERGRARALRFKAAMDLARETIQAVAQDTHRRWAEFLNQRATEIVRVVGGGIEQLRFGDDLEFSVKLAGSHMPRGKAALQLSAGARDQLYLAVRLAISEYLSNGRTPLPLLVDDCFATSDDDRVRAGMKTLIELSSRHQVIVVTCHRKRFQTLAAQDGELYAARVHWLDLGAKVSE